MDLGDIANSCADLGLAQTIQKGLDGKLAKEPNWGTPEQQDAMREKLTAGRPDLLYSTPLGHKCMLAWSRRCATPLGMKPRISARDGRSSGQRSSTENSVAEPTAETLRIHWPKFCASKEFEVLCRYMCVVENYREMELTPQLFQEMRPLGKGAFGLVTLSFKKDTGRPFAIKKIMKANIKKNGVIKDVLIESEVLKKVHSRFLVNLHYALQDDACVCLVLTLCPGGDLAYLIASRCTRDAYGNKGVYNRMPLHWITFYAASIALGLDAVHKAQYVYRDLKPQNILLDMDGQVKISDLGLALSFKNGPISKRSGTRGYWAPEVVEKKPARFEPDYFSLGVTIFVLFCDKMPFPGKNDEEKDEATLTKEIAFKNGEPQLLQNVISELCDKDMSKRLGCRGRGIEEVKAHPYFAETNWPALEAGILPAPFVPDANDINAPSVRDVEAFKVPKDVKWSESEQQLFRNWTYVNEELLQQELCLRMDRMGDLTGGGKSLNGGDAKGAGGCCTVS